MKLLTLNTHSVNSDSYERNIDALKIGLFNVSSVHTLPCISSFVGADIVAGLSTLKAPKKGKYPLKIISISRENKC